MLKEVKVEEGFTTEFDKKLLEKCEIYQKHPQLLPFIGKNYGNEKCNKLLLIGESHNISNTYLCGEKKGKDRKKEELDYIFKNWYKISNSDLNDEECKDIGWTRTRETIMYPGARFNVTIRKELGENISYISFMNFFQKPAYKGKSIGFSEEDVKIAKETLQLVCNIIQPDCLLFASKNAYGNFDKNAETFQNKVIDYVYNPACRWWYRNEGKYGQQKFIDFFQKNVMKGK
jgi:hypothetical protein